MKKILFVTIDPIENRRRVLNQIEIAIEAGFDAEAISYPDTKNGKAINLSRILPQGK